jgi:tetratricopeptide (TPR) repeat protein
MPFFLRADETNNYAGEVGGQKLVLTLTWHDNRDVSGSYYCPGGRNRVYVLRGTNPHEGELLLTEYTEGSATASIKLLKYIEGASIVWRGMMYNYDGRNKSMSFQRRGKSTTPQRVDEPLDMNNEELVRARVRQEILEAQAEVAAAKREANKADNRAAQALLNEVAVFWKVDPTIDDIPKGLPVALALKLEQAVMAANNTPSLALAHAVHRSLTSSPLDLAVVAKLLLRESNFQSAGVPWADSFSRILANRKKQSIALQEEALKLLVHGDGNAAEKRMERALAAYPCHSLSQYTTALALFNNLSRDKALRAVDDWSNPSLLDRELTGKASTQASLLRELAGNEVFPELLDLAWGLDAAGLLDGFSAACEPAGAKDCPHPVRALLSMRKSESYRHLQSNNSIFAKPFLDRIKYLEVLIGPKAVEYEQYIDKGNALEAEGKFLQASAAYRNALGIERSLQLEEKIRICESKSSGL